MYLILLLAVTAVGEVPEACQGVWYVTHEQDMVTEEWRRVGRAELRVEADHFKHRDGTITLVVNAHGSQEKGWSIRLEGNILLIVIPGEKFLVGWYQIRDGKFIKFRQWLVQVR